MVETPNGKATISKFYFTELGFLMIKFAENVMKWVRKDHVQTTSHWTKNWLRASLKK